MSNLYSHVEKLYNEQFDIFKQVALDKGITPESVEELAAKQLKDQKSGVQDILDTLTESVSDIFTELKSAIAAFSDQDTVKKFFETMPVMRHKLEYVNSKGDKKTFIIEGLKTFFL
jgi:hypothetical protein